MVEIPGERMADCAQVFARAFTRELPHTRSIYSFIGTPMKLR